MRLRRHLWRGLRNLPSKSLAVGEVDGLRRLERGENPCRMVERVAIAPHAVNDLALTRDILLTEHDQSLGLGKMRQQRLPVHRRQCEEGGIRRARGRETVCRPRLKAASTGATVATAIAGVGASMITRSAGLPSFRP